MINSFEKKTKKYWELEYKTKLKFQRKYPSEDLSRYIGRNYVGLSSLNKNKINILDVGCGIGNNLNLLINENFNSYGLDLSYECISYLKELYKGKKNKPTLKVGNMKSLPFNNKMFDLIIDIFSSYALNKSDGQIFINEVCRCLKKNGKFFSVFPSKNSDAWKKEGYKKRIDHDTLMGFQRKQSPYFGNNYPFRFMNKQNYIKLLEKNGFKIDYLEKNMRTYNSMKEKFEFLIIECTKV